jgi:thioredoxin reductase
MKQQTIWDVIIIGAGPAGSAAAIVLARSRRNVLVMDEGIPRNRQSKGIHNYLTRENISPAKFRKQAFSELRYYGVRAIKAKAVKAKKTRSVFQIQDSNGAIYTCRKLLLATGVTDDIPGIPGMKELWGTSVFHCPYCDGWENRNKIIGLYASKKNGHGMSLLLRQLSDNVILFTDGIHYLRPYQKQRLQQKNIRIITTRITQFEHKSKILSNIILSNGEAIPCDALFVLHHYHVNDTLLLQLGCRCSKKGAALTNRSQQTSVAGVYAAGDASFDMHMIAVAAAEGVKAAISINSNLLKDDK